MHGMCGGSVICVVLTPAEFRPEFCVGSTSEHAEFCAQLGISFLQCLRNTRIDELYLMQCWIVHRHAVEHGGHVVHGMCSGTVQCGVDVSMCVVCGWVTD